MTETSSKGALRSTTVMFLFVGLYGVSVWVDVKPKNRGLKD